LRRSSFESGAASAGGSSASPTRIIGSLRHASCDPRQDDLWKGTLLFAALAAGGALTLGLGLAWRKSLRWLALVTVPLGSYAVFVVVPGVTGTTLDGAALCATVGALRDGVDRAAYPATTLQRIWSPVQLVVLSAAALQALRHWRPG
jgi:hypothetical protein